MGEVLPLVVLGVVLRTLQKNEESKHRGRGEYHGVVLTEVVDTIYLSYMPASGEIISTVINAISRCTETTAVTLTRE